MKQEYRKKAKKVDQEVLGLGEGEKGPVERRLDEFGELLGLSFGGRPVKESTNTGRRQTQITWRLSKKYRYSKFHKDYS